MSYSHPLAAPKTKFLGKLPSKVGKKTKTKIRNMYDKRSRRRVSKRQMAGNYNQMMD